MNLKDVEKMLWAIINGQSSMKQELKADIKKLNQKLSKKIDIVDVKVDKNVESLDRIDRQLAYLEDDTSTREGHNHLEKRVTKIEQRIASA